MASTYSSRLRIELIGTGEQSGTWGITTNTNLGTLIEEAIAGVASITMTDADYTLTTANGATDQARQMVLNMSGTLSATRNVICPAVQKLYVVQNATTGGYSITIKTAAGTGVAVPNGTATLVYCDGTNVVPAMDAFTGNLVIGDSSADTLTINSTVQPGVVISGSSSSNALRVTQTGSGNALLVEDAANPDGSPFVIDASGNVGIGLTAPAYGFNSRKDTTISDVQMASATYDSVSFSVSAQEADPNAVFFSPDGRNMYVMGPAGDDVNQYILSTAWTVSSATYVRVFSVSSQDSAPVGLYFREDGLKMYIVGQTNDTVYQYALTSPWDISTASYESKSFSVAGQDITPAGIYFRDNGTRMFMVGSTGDAVYQYNLATAWDVSTASYIQSFSVASQEVTPQDISFVNDGTRMFILGSNDDDITIYNLTTPWDISTASYSSTQFSVASQENAPTGLYVRPDGLKMYVVGLTNDTVYQYSVPSLSTRLVGATEILGSADVWQDITVYGTGYFKNAFQVPISSTTTAAPAAGYIRFNTTTVSFEGYNGTDWSQVGGGATGGGTDNVFYLNDQTVTTNYSIPSGQNAGTFGPVTINSGVTVTVPSGSVWTVV
jgi:hypothetical protein